MAAQGPHLFWVWSPPEVQTRVFLTPVRETLFHRMMFQKPAIPISLDHETCDEQRYNRQKKGGETVIAQRRSTSVGGLFRFFGQAGNASLP
jgi:hypothetical protein